MSEDDGDFTLFRTIYKEINGTMKKTIIITEEQMKALSNAIRSNSENELPKKAAGGR